MQVVAENSGVNIMKESHMVEIDRDSCASTINEINTRTTSKACGEPDNIVSLIVVGRCDQSVESGHGRNVPGSWFQHEEFVTLHENVSMHVKVCELRQDETSAADPRLENLNAGQIYRSQLV